MHDAGLKEPPAPLSLHVTEPDVIVGELDESATWAEYVTELPADKVAELGVTTTLVGCRALEVDCGIDGDVVVEDWLVEEDVVDDEEELELVDWGVDDWVVDGDVVVEDWLVEEDVVVDVEFE